MAPRTTHDWPRDYVGYGKNPPNPQWPGDARIALNFNLNYETGGEANILDGDPASEGLLNDIGFPPVPGNAIRSRNQPLSTARESVSGGCCASSPSSTSLSAYSAWLQRLTSNPEVTHAFVEGGHEIVSHGYRWIDYHFVDPEVDASICAAP